MVQTSAKEKEMSFTHFQNIPLSLKLTNCHCSFLSSYNLMEKVHKLSYDYAILYKYILDIPIKIKG